MKTIINPSIMNQGLITVRLNIARLKIAHCGVEELKIE